jgi:UDP-N-acetylmuramoylalanine--D-glutamate ligase
MRILGTGKTALAIKEVYKNALLYDDSNINEYNKNSDDLTVVSPGMPPSHQLVKDTKNLISEYDLFFDQMPFSVWISGTNGKTTTTRMLQHLLSDYNSLCGGNIGIPIAQMDTNKDIWILETSSFTLHYTNKAKPNIYVLLPVSDDHLSWHGTYNEYEKSKLKPLKFMTQDDIAIIPAKFRYIKTEAKVVYYNTSFDIEKEYNINRDEVNYKEPFLMDAILALAVSKIIINKIDYNLINSFIQDPHKLEEFRDLKNRLWVDDSKATNIDATIQALKIYKEKKIFLILGGDVKGVNLNPLFEEMKNYDISLYLIGQNINKLYKLSTLHNIQSVKSYYLKDAVKEIKNANNYCANNVCLLSPAAGSLDQFSSYKERGEKFKEFVYSHLN